MKKKLAAENTEQNPIYFITFDTNVAKNLIVELNPR